MSDQTGADGAPATTDSTAGAAPAEDVKSLPPWAQTMIGDLRREAGGYRTAKTAAEKAAEEWQGKAVEHENAVKAATEQLSKTELNVAKLKAALLTKQTGEQALVFAERLQGSTPEEIAADAAKLASFFGGSTSTTSTVKPDPSQGQGGSDMALNGDPLEQSLRNALGIT